MNKPPLGTCAMLTRRQLLLAAASAAVLPVFGPVRAVAQVRRYGFFATRAAARDGFVYGLPMVMTQAVMFEHAIDRHSGRFKAPINRIKNEERVFTHTDKPGDLPNNDALRSLVWLDLRAEPMVLSVPAVDRERYYSITLRDGRFYDFGYIGPRVTGTEAGDYMVAGPDWNGEIPPGITKVFRSSTQFSFALYRTQLFDPDDIDNVRKVQVGYGLKPLSRSGGRPAASPAPIIHFQKIRTRSLRNNFFQHLAFALRFAPSRFIESSAYANLTKLGVGPGRTFDFEDLSLKRKLEITLGIRAGDRQIDRAIAAGDVVLNGWRVAGGHFGNGAFYGGNWLSRAAAAKADFFGSEPAEAVSLFARFDEHGRTLDCGEHDYALTFARDRMPPVNAFWSLTAYDSRSRSLVANSISRYLVNSSMLSKMKMNESGLTIYVQKSAPDTGKRANWLPAPDGRLFLVLRLYWPKAEPPSILPIGKGTWQPPAVKRTS